MLATLERLHKTMRKELFTGRSFASIAEAQAELDAWVTHYNGEGPSRRFRRSRCS
ncbi:MAG: transposase [Actinobacteria bacterium]|nr:MAG: transposase [Actinomycetota bacterium]